MKTDLRTIRQSHHLKLKEMLKNNENIEPVVQYIEELREVLDAAHDIVLDWRAHKELHDITPHKIADFMDWLDEGLTRIGYVPESEDE